MSFQFSKKQSRPEIPFHWSGGEARVAVREMQFEK